MLPVNHGIFDALSFLNPYLALFAASWVLSRLIILILILFPLGSFNIYIPSSFNFNTDNDPIPLVHFP